MRRCLVLSSCLVAGLAFAAQDGAQLRTQLQQAGGDYAAAEQLYMNLKADEAEIPAWLNDMVNPPAQNDASRTGGETMGTATAITFAPGGTYSDPGTTVGTANDYDTALAATYCQVGSNLASAFGAGDVFYTFTSTGQYTVSAEICNANYDSVLGIINSAGVLVAMNDDGGGCATSSRSQILNCCLPADTYYIVVDGYSTGTGTYTLNVAFGTDACLPPCDTYNANIATLVAPGVSSGTTVGDPHVYAGVGGDQGINITIPYASLWDIDACFAGTNYAADIYLFTASPCSGGTLLTSNTSGTCVAPGVATTGRILNYSLAAGTYHLLVGHTGTTEGTYEVLVQESPNCVNYNNNTLSLNAPGSITGTTVGMPHVYGGTGGDQGIDITIPYFGEWNLDACNAGTGYAADLYLFTDSPCQGGTLIISNTSATCAAPSTTARILNYPLAAGTYHLLVGHTGTTTGTFDVSVYTSAPRPTAGGPDAFGHTWKNSFDPEGPTYNWVEISEIGTPIILSGADGYSSAIAMGMTFPYYESTYTNVYVDADGFISFNLLGALYYSNQAIPAVAMPQNVIAAFWDDLYNTGATAYSYYDAANSRFIIEYKNFTKSSIPMTFEIILYANGNILVQYQNVAEGLVNSLSAGMEDGAGVRGLQVSYNDTGGTGGAIWDGTAYLYTRPVGDVVPPSIVHTALGNTEDTVNPYIVNANITDLDNSVASATVYYQVDGGGYTAVPMTAGTPPLYSAAIPAQSAGSDVQYYIQATDTAVPANTGNSAVFAFSVVDFTLAPTGLSASDGLLDVVNLTWTAPAWLALAADPGPEPVFENFLPLHATKDAAWQAFQTAHTEWLAAQVPADRSFQTYNIYRDNVLVGTSATTTYVDHPSTGDIFTYHVTALFDGGESANSNSDTGYMVPRPTTGGPDDFGYTWENSNNPTRVSFNWVDISSTGTPLVSPTDDGFQGPFTIGFNFPFYENAYTGVYIASNGFISFGTGNGSLSNVAIPTAGTPNNFIAPFWDDMNPASVNAGTIWYQYDGVNNQFIVQYHVVAYSGSVYYDFQVILKPDGSILVQHLNVNEADVSEATVGIENSTGLDGLQVNFNGTGGAIQDNLATLFTRPQGDVIGPVIVHTPLTDTEYDGPYAVSANITDEESNVASATLYYRVNGGAYTFVVMTAGTPPLYTAAIPDQTPPATIDYYIVALDDSPNANDTTSPTWSFDVVDWTWAPQNLAASDGLLGEVLVTWSAPAPIAETRAAVVVDVPTIEELMASGLSKEAAYLRVSEMTNTVDAGRAFLLYNVYRDNVLIGTSTGLSYVDVPPTVITLYTYHVTALFDAGESNNSNSDTGFMTARPTSGGPDTFGYSWMNSDDPSGNVAYSWTDISSNPSAVAHVLADDSWSNKLAIGFAFPFYGVNKDSVSIASNGFLSFTRDTYTFSNGTIPSASTPNDLVAPFWDDLYPAEFDLDPAYGTIHSLSDVGNGRFIVQFTDVPHYGSTTLDDTYTFQVILQSDGQIYVTYLDMQGVRNSATVGIENATGTDGLMVNNNDAGGRIGNNLTVRFRPLIPCASPSNVNVMIASGNATITWDAVAEAISYDVYAAPDGYGPFTLLTTTASTSITDLGAQSAGRKFYQVVAVCD